MLSQKLVKKLADKKTRAETRLFMVEGRKNILELLNSDFTIETIYGTLEFIETIEQIIAKSAPLHTPELVALTEEALLKMGTLQSNNAGIAVAFQKSVPEAHTFLHSAETGILLALDDVRDPGNLGTIIRTADWFGVTYILASETTADFYNPKTIAASMGSFTRMTVGTGDLFSFLKSAADTKIPIMGATLDGKNVFSSPPKRNGILLMGSESHGIHEDLLPFVSNRITIPRFGNAESLNVATATAILLAELRRGG